MICEKISLRVDAPSEAVVVTPLSGERFEAAGVVFEVARLTQRYAVVRIVAPEGARIVRREIPPG